MGVDCPEKGRCMGHGEYTAVNGRDEFRDWFMEHADTESECWVRVRKGRSVDDERLW